MRAKLDEKERAIKLRKDGWSVRKIAETLDVSRGSVSLWVRDVELTKKQKEQLMPNSRLRVKVYHEVAGRKKVLAENTRKAYQVAGRAKAQKSTSDLYVMGCMLYWAEGAKARTSLRFTNSDPDMVRIFMRFLREACGVNENKISLKVAAYLGNDLSWNDIEHHWLDVTGLSAAHLRKGTVKEIKDSRRHKLPYGTVVVVVHSVECLQKIYGSICEFASIDGTKWL